MKKLDISPKHIIEYIYDQSVDIEKRTFVLFSVLTLLAIFVAVPCGLIMREPISATISTFIGAIFFSIYVYYSIKKDLIERARVVLSVILVFIFLPAMFFTNGGVNGGAPIWLLLGTIYIALILEGKIQRIMLILDGIVLIVCWLVGYYFPDLITEYPRGGNFFDNIAGLFIVSAIVYILIRFQLSLYRKEEEDKNLKRLFGQTATALVNAIDAKDEYTHGHSSRVAEYSKKIAEMSGKSPSECEEIYYIALLHDVGKIGIADNIINKKGKLTDDEYKVIKQHPVLGAQILKGINEYPNLILGANYHHERYDGKGYPEGLKGDDIPEVARIISVADAYDAMTSTRSYRDSIPQQTVREEIVKGSGTQFDPRFAKIMQHHIDLDTEYTMRERNAVKELSGKSDLFCNKIRDDISDGIQIGPAPVIKRIKFKCNAIDKRDRDFEPCMILFDSLDARYHDNAREIKDLNYFEYAQIWLDGKYEIIGARKIRVKESKSNLNVDTKAGRKAYEIEGVKVKDHMLIKIDDGVKLISITIALPDSARYTYIGLTGDNCHIYDVSMSQEEEYVANDYIERIAEEISYINVPAGDIPNIQIDGYRIDSTEGIPVRDGMKISFHTMSLPTARMIWHCPFVDLFYSADKKPNGEDYKEYALIRMDGEFWDAEKVASNKLNVNRGIEFKGWDAWKEAQKAGFDSTVSFSIKDDKIITSTENLGISIVAETTIIEKAPEVYVSLTGDQCALTNIRIKYDKNDKNYEEDNEKG